MNKINVSCFQTNSSQYPDKNIYMLEKMFNSIQQKNVELVCLPECVAVFSESLTKINLFFDQWKNKFLDLLAHHARRMNSHILIGSIPYKKVNGKFFNRSLLIGKDGKVLCHYDKINLFDVDLDNNEKYMESKNYDPGKHSKTISLPWGVLGFSICYDLRFPKLYKKLASDGATCFSIPAAFTFTTGRYHWHTLLKSRAIENGCYIFAPAQFGFHDNGRRTFGHSMIIDPWGKVLKEANKKNSVITAKINLDLVDTVRKKIPSMNIY